MNGTISPSLTKAMAMADRKGSNEIMETKVEIEIVKINNKKIKEYLVSGGRNEVA